MKKILLLLIVVFTAMGGFAQDSEPDYLCFEVQAGTSVSCTLIYPNEPVGQYNIEYSYDKNTWNSFNYFGGIVVDNNCKIYFRGDNPNGTYSYSVSNGIKFNVSKPFKCSGSIMTLVEKTGKTTSITARNAFYRLFENTPIITAPKLPATTIGECCYISMFNNCTELTTPPEELPALNLALCCYQCMFNGCVNLKKAPDLPATKLAKWCYASMFRGCTSLRKAPKLKKFSKYAESAYSNMFNGCTNMNYISVGFKTWHTAGSTNSLITDCWVQNVAPSGTFVCPKELEQKYGDSWIPTGWNVKYIEDLYSVTIPESSQPYITIAQTTEIDAGEEISFSIVDRSSEGYNATVSVQGIAPIEPTQSGNDYVFTMPEEDVIISVSYTPIKYSITTDAYSSAATEASAGETVNVTFANREGYNLTSATYNGNALTISDNAASFTMPAEEVNIATTYTPIDYDITSDQYATPSKNPANVGDVINVTFSQRDGYNLTSATYNDNPLTITNNSASFTMPAEAVTIATTYTPINYTITADQYATPSKNPANVGDVINVSFAKREGYNLTSATYNDNPLTITNYTASFTMPAAAVTIATTYTPIDYDITSDQYATPSKNPANVGDVINVTFAKRDGYNLTSATYNDNPLTITNNTASFTMPAANVTIATTYTPIDYDITSDRYATPSKNPANVGDVINVTFATRPGYNLTSATYNSNALTITNNNASFTMPAENVTIATTYTIVDFTITADQYSSPNKTTANFGDEITVTFANRDGYNLTSATYNGTALTITNNAASFTMPAANVTIATTYTKIDYTITADQYSTPNKTTANVGDEITVTFANRDGYSLTSATYNGTALNITNNTASFTMPAANVTIATTYTPIEYNITAGEYVTANKSKATINDQVSFTVADRTADGYQLDKVLINNAEISGTSFNMADYLTDVTITAVYSKIGYTITSDAYSTPSKTKANVGDEITVTFSKRDGYNLTSATYNGTALTIVDYKSQFTMPDEDVEIKTVYTVEQQQITKPEIITDNNVEITLPENLTENSEVTFTVQQKPGFTAFVYVNGVLTNEYKFVFTGKVEIKVDYKELTVSNISAETESYCAGDDINLTFATNPYAVEYELTFSNEAQKEGFENIDFHPVASYEQQPASFKIPQSAKPGKYHAFIRVKDSKDSHSKQYAFDFEVLYPTDIIETKYSDLICVNNSKNEYIGYQWFKNNKEIKGADKQFYIDAPMLNGSYSVALILKNGEKSAPATTLLAILRSKRV